MIIPEKHLQAESSKIAEASGRESQVQPDQSDDVLPPAYTDHLQDAQPTNDAYPTGPPLKAQPTNFLSLHEKDGHIRGCYTIDPLMRVPTSLLAPLGANESEEDRRNLDLRTKDGHVDAEIWLLGRKVEDLPTISKERTTLYLSSRDGNVSARVNTVDVTAPFLLDIYARDGRVTVLLPRSFHGPLLLTSRSSNSVILSDAILEKSTPLSTLDRTRRFFVGPTSEVTGQDWHGDELKVEARDGKIRVRYIDEIDTTAKGGFLSRVFSL
ncbi:hypothetical protein BV22DRAFT_1131929 [Leucogyrophana mollusca]|uniref:Uncharacterized protein n=1 Tax=Leucogyrophana mollusca TaxID=85980 RepID=A0ACB8B8D3_9AGAM|nr:hypothetical protein BV22DRAFT_1131929 [Leucogyrophana mollusca]